MIEIIEHFYFVDNCIQFDFENEFKEFNEKIGTKTEAQILSNYKSNKNFRDFVDKIENIVTRLITSTSNSKYFLELTKKVTAPVQIKSVEIAPPIIKTTQQTKNLEIKTIVDTKKKAKLDLELSNLMKKLSDKEKVLSATVKKMNDINKNTKVPLSLKQSVTKSFKDTQDDITDIKNEIKIKQNEINLI